MQVLQAILESDLGLISMRGILLVVCVESAIVLWFRLYRHASVSVAVFVLIVHWLLVE